MPKSEAAACLPHDASLLDASPEQAPFMQDNTAGPEFRSMSLRFAISALLSLSLVALSLSQPALVAAAMDTGSSPAWRIFITSSISYSAWIQLALATPVIFYGGWPLLARGVASIISRKFNMFTLSTLGIGISYIYSLAVTVMSQGQTPVFFMAAAVITTLALLGQLLELKVRGNTHLAQTSVQRFADAAADWLVPVAVLIAAATAYAWWHFGPEPKMAPALMNAVAVLVIACPFALCLAASMPLMAGVVRGEKAGIRFKDAGILETLAKADTLIIDKTGTLTEGKPKLASIVTANGFDETTVLKLAASLEHGCEHPLASAILRCAEEKNIPLLPVATFKTFPGKGVIGMTGGHKVVLGTLVLLRELSIPADTLQKQAEVFRHKGQTVIFVGIDGQAAGFIVITDPVRKTAGEAVRFLKESGLRIMMLTGDNQTTAESIGRKLGITDIEAGITPERKAQIIRDLQSRKHVVAVAGDSHNDAPAFSKANISIEMTSSTEWAMHTSGIIVLQDNLIGLARARHLSQLTLKNIRQNLFLAAGYNVLAIPLAAGVLYPHLGVLINPMIASAAMTLGAAMVIGNALRIRSLKL